MPSDAVHERPTIEQELDKFKSFATVEGAVTADNADAPGDRGQAKPAKQEAESEENEEPKAAEATEEPAEESGEKTPQEDPKAKPAKPGRSPSDRIGDLTRNWRQAQRDLEAERDARARERADFEARLAKLEKGELTPPTSGAKTQRSDTDAPDPKDYEFGELDVRYIEDRTRYAVRQELKAERERASQNQQRDAAARQAQENAERAQALVEKGAEKYDDFEEVVMQGARDGVWPLSETVGKLLLTADPEIARDIAYHLASNPKEARKVAGLTDYQQAAYFGRLEAQFSSPADAKITPIKVPKASPPPENRARGGGGATPDDDDSEDFAAFEAKWRRAQAR